MISEISKTRLATNIRDLKQSPGWRFLRQLATAEAAEEKPDWDGLRSVLLDTFNAAIEEEFRNGIERQKGSATRTTYPGAAR